MPVIMEKLIGFIFLSGVQGMAKNNQDYSF